MIMDWILLSLLIVSLIAEGVKKFYKLSEVDLVDTVQGFRVSRKNLYLINFHAL
jgi:hypothetical protein